MNFVVMVNRYVGFLAYELGQKKKSANIETIGFLKAKIDKKEFRKLTSPISL